MELNISKFVRTYRNHMHNFSSSIARSGLDNIGEVTWRNAMEAMADESDWLTSELSELVDYFAGFGAWDREELEAMSGQELNALLVQFVAGDFQGREEARERGRKALREYEENWGGRLGGSRGRWFYYVGI